MHQKLIHFDYGISYADSPYWAFAIHDGHAIDPALQPYLKLSEAERLREEDPHTQQIASLPIGRLSVSTSRFQLDLNRDKSNAIYLRPKQAWGLDVWSDQLPKYYIEQLYHHHDHIYDIIDKLIQNTIAQYGYFVVYDIHSYNAKRSGPDEKVDEQNNPQIIVGTGHNNEKWNDLAQAFIHGVRQQHSASQIDIRENVKFRGGNLSKFINSKYQEYGCVLSVEFRKDFMNEWTGEVFQDKVESCKQLLVNTVETLDNYFRKESFKK